MRASVNDGLCRGHGVCVALCPEVFTLTDWGYAEAIGRRRAGGVRGRGARRIEASVSSDDHRG